MREWKRLTKNPVLRFFVVGGSNTLATSMLLVLLSFFMPGWLAYTISYAAGIVYATLMTGQWVFSAKPSLAESFIYAGCYVVIYMIGLVIVKWIESLGLPTWTSVAVVMVTAPLGYLAGRFVFVRSPSRTKERVE